MKILGISAFYHDSAACLLVDGRIAAASGLGPGNAVARDIRLAEMLIEKNAAPDPDALADPDTSLKKLLRA